MPLTLDTSMPPRDTPEDPPTPAAQLSPLKSPTHFAVERPFSPRSSKFTFDDGAPGGDEPARSAADSPKADEFLRDVYRSGERVNEAGVNSANEGFEAPALTFVDDDGDAPLTPFRVGGGDELGDGDDDDDGLGDVPWYALPFCTLPMCNCTASF